jgi:heat shock protein 5
MEAVNIFQSKFAAYSSAMSIPKTLSVLADQVYSTESSVNDQEGLGGKLSSSDKKTIQAAIKEAKEWMESNPDATAEDLEERQAEFSSTVQPIISSFYEGAAGGEQETYGSHDEL